MPGASGSDTGAEPRGGSPPERDRKSGRPAYALGINYYDHDAAAVLVRDGRVVDAPCIGPFLVRK